MFRIRLLVRAASVLVGRQVRRESRVCAMRFLWRVLGYSTGL